MKRLVFIFTLFAITLSATAQLRHAMPSAMPFSAIISSPNIGKANAQKQRINDSRLYQNSYRNSGSGTQAFNPQYRSGGYGGNKFGRSSHTIPFAAANTQPGIRRAIVDDSDGDEEEEPITPPNPWEDPLSTPIGNELYILLLLAAGYITSVSLKKKRHNKTMNRLANIFAFLIIAINCTYAQDCPPIEHGTATATFTQAMPAFVLLKDGSTQYTEATIDNIADADEKKAALWFKDNYVSQGKGCFISTDDLATLGDNVDKYSMVWIMSDRWDRYFGDGGNEPSWMGRGLFSTEKKNGLKAYVQKGGNLFLSNFATCMLFYIDRVEFGADTRDNNYLFSYRGNRVVEGDNLTANDNNDVWYLQPYVGFSRYGAISTSNHPIFAGLTTETTNNNDAGGKSVDCYPLVGVGRKANHNCFWWINSYDNVAAQRKLNSWGGRTLGIWNGTISFTSTAVAEWLPIEKDTYQFKGSIITVGIGAYEWDQAQWDNVNANPYQANIERLTKNIIDYLSKK